MRRHGSNCLAAIHICNKRAISLFNCIRRTKDELNVEEKDDAPSGVQSNLKANCHSDSQEILHPLYNIKGYCHIHKRSQLFAIRSRLNPVHILTPYLFKISFNIALFK
jgi:hypothetical protein